MTAHPARAVRRPTGWKRWYAACPCGWSDTTVGGKEQAEAAAAAHEHGSEPF
ncbi:MAG TPA: hypothetical protein VFH56_06675 [Acidimicrobiales bacterium]|nr:hypothetical protein [Acidimicrobiales bacterium]